MPVTAGTRFAFVFFCQKKLTAKTHVVLHARLQAHSPQQASLQACTNNDLLRSPSSTPNTNGDLSNQLFVIGPGNATTTTVDLPQRHGALGFWHLLPCVPRLLSFTQHRLGSSVV